MKKITFAEVQKYILENDINKDCTLLSTEYKNSKEKMLFRCNSCGKEFERSFTNIKRNESFKCAVCAQGRKLSIDDVKKFLSENDKNKECELLSESYTNYNSFLEFKCNCCGKIFKRKYSQVKEGNFSCYDCLKKKQGGKNKLNIKIVEDFIKENDKNNYCTLLSQNYINQYEPLLFKCNCCGKEFERNYATMRSKKSFKCYRCAHSLPEEPTSDIYRANVSYFRGKLHLWKKNFLNNHSTCDLTNTTEDLEIHHLINFSVILNQASINTNIPLEYRPQELKEHGYSLEVLTQEFLKLHENAPAVLLNKKYHQLFHKMFGYKNNTPEQYYEFKEKYFNNELNILCNLEVEKDE